MAKYEVLRPIEHNGKLYLPKVDAASGKKILRGSGIDDPAKAGPTTISAAHGGEVPVEASGVIELAEKEALALELGQISPLKGRAKRAEDEDAKKKK